MHKLNKEEFDIRINAKALGKGNLTMPHKAPKNVPELRERVYQIERYLGFEDSLVEV